MSNQGDVAQVKCCQQLCEVCSQLVDAVAGLRCVRVAVAAGVERDGPVISAQTLKEWPPDLLGKRKALMENNSRPGSGIGVRQANAVGKNHVCDLCHMGILTKLIKEVNKNVCS